MFNKNRVNFVDKNNKKSVKNTLEFMMLKAQK